MSPNEAEMTPRHHAERIAGAVSIAAQEAHVDIQRVNDPKAGALFETVCEVPIRTIKALEDEAQQREAVRR